VPFSADTEPEDPGLFVGEGIVPMLLVVNVNMERFVRLQDHTDMPPSATPKLTKGKRHILAKTPAVEIYLGTWRSK